MSSENHSYSTMSICGSDSVNDALICWSIGLGVVLTFTVGIMYENLRFNCASATTIDSKMSKNLTKSRIQRICDLFLEELSNKSTRQNRNIILTGRFLNRLRIAAILITALLLVLFLPEYAILNIYLGKWGCTDLWIISSTKLTGYVNGILIFLSVIAITVVFSLICAKFVIAPDDFLVMDTIDSDRDDDNVSVTSCCLTIQRSLANFAIITLNFGLSILINILYVFSVESKSYNIAMLTQICVSLYQILWNFVILPRFGLPMWTEYMHLSSGRKSTRNINFFRCQLVVMNSVIVPCLATAGYSKSCLYHLFVPESSSSPNTHTNSSSISSSLSISMLPWVSHLPLRALSSVPYGGQQQPAIPAVEFRYSYECSSQLLFIFSSQLTFQLTMLTIAMPLFLLSLRALSTYIPKDKSNGLYTVVNAVLPEIFKVVSKDEPSHDSLIIFDKYIFCTMVVSMFAILLSFGAMFPLLGMAAGVSVVIATILLQGAVGFALSVADDCENYQYRNVLDSNLSGLADTFVDILPLLVPWCSAFYALFVFDILGGEVGWQGALPAALILLALPLLLVLAGRIKRLFVPNYAKVYVEQQARLLFVQTTYQRDVYQQFSPLAAKVSRSMKSRNSPDNITYAYRRPVNRSSEDGKGSPPGSPSSFSSSAFSAASPSKSTKRNMQLIDLESYVN